jgi:thioredoxin-like negative regulator of GroEL
VLEEVAARTKVVEVVLIDALEQPELAEQYGILTVPSTVVLAANGHATAVNYGFAPASELLEQIEAAVSSLSIVGGIGD